MRPAEMVAHWPVPKNAVDCAPAHMRQNIGIYGGTFNPIHLGHLVSAQDAVEQLRLDRLFWVPCAQPPHKSGAPLASADDRCALIEAAIAGDPRMRLCPWEIERGGVSYTVDTLRRFRAEFPKANLFFLIGADSLYELHTWREIGAIFELCRIVTVARPGFAIRRSRIRLPRQRVARLLRDVVPGHEIGVSSTEIRRRLAVGRSIRYLVPAAVEALIRARGLYGAGRTRPPRAAVGRATND